MGGEGVTIGRVDGQGATNTPVCREYHHTCMPALHIVQSIGPQLSLAWLHALPNSKEEFNTYNEMVAHTGAHQGGRHNRMHRCGLPFYANIY